MERTTTNLQDIFLNTVRREAMSITVFLMNGFQFKGIVKSFDGFTILMEVDSNQQLIYKHAISTIVPSKNISI